MTQIFLPILSAILLSVTFSSFNLWLFAWIGFLPLFICLEKKSLLQSFLISYFCGIVFWGLTIYWLIHVTFIGQAVLIMYLAVYFGIFGGLVYISRTYTPGSLLLFIPAGWVLLEYLRSYLFTGFPWALLGFSQYSNLPVIQLADIAGSWGVSFLVILMNTCIYLVFRRGLKPRIIFACLGIFILSLGYGFYRLNYKTACAAGAERVRVSVVQGNIPQDLKWDKQSASGILNNYMELTAAAAKDGSSLIIWPEASMPVLWGDIAADTQFRRVFDLAAKLNTNLLVGAVSRFGSTYFNSALFINNLGYPEKVYSKLHLVPFGEFVPLKDIFPFLQSVAPIADIEPGKEYTIFNRPEKFSVLICFEDLFPELSREFVRKGARFLVNITNDAWYKQGSAAYQHFAASVFRAVENRVYLVRAANTGISGFIDPLGRISSMVEDACGRRTFVRGYNSGDIYLSASGRTIYNRYGDLFVFFCLLLEAGIIWFNLKKRFLRDRAG